MVIALVEIVLIEMSAEDAEGEREVNGPQKEEEQKDPDLADAQYDELDKLAEGRLHLQEKIDLEECHCEDGPVQERNEDTSPVVIGVLYLHIMLGLT